MKATALASSILRHAPALVSASARSRCRVGGLTAVLPWERSIRLSIVAGNMRLHRILDRVVTPGDVVVDVGANVGYNTLYLARLVGPTGHVVALEPTPDNLRVLRDQLATNHLRTVDVQAVAAGARRETRELFLRGDVSGVNSLYPDGCFGPISGRLDVPVVPLDDVVAGQAHLVKIDVEGAELEVLDGMSRLLTSSSLQLVVEWHPALQVAAGYAAEDLPRSLLDRGFSLIAAWHTHEEPLTRANVPRMAERLMARHRSIELLAMHPEGRR